MKSTSLHDWRDYFHTANSDIFDIINHAITVAATDWPNEFRLRRDEIAEKLFCCRFIGFSTSVATAVPHDSGAGGSKESKVNSNCRDDQDIEEMQNGNHMVNNYSHGDVETLTDEIEEAHQTVEEVLRIKNILLNNEHGSDTLLFDSLRRLQLMALTVDILKATEIGKAVNGLRKHGSNQICQLARTLIEVWKELVDEWVNSTKAVAGEEGTPDSVNPSVLDEEQGLPSPPLDDGIFFATQPISMELSQFFDGMDDDGNLRNNGECIKKRENTRRPLTKNENTRTVDNSGGLKKQDTDVKLKHGEAVLNALKPVKVTMVQKADHESKMPFGRQREEKLKCPVSNERKLEATKRKLQESYREVENEKKQRTIKVVEFQDIPKQGVSQKNQHTRAGHHRQRANGRR